MPRKTRASSRKTRRNKATRRRRYRSRRMRGGDGVTSCPAGSVHILEDGLETAGPDQIICYGDSLTSCTTVTVVMEDNWKIGAHMQSPTYVHRLEAKNPNNKSKAPAQRVNPETILPLIKDKLTNDVNFIGKSIKAIYIVGEPTSFHIYNKHFDISTGEGKGEFEPILNNAYSEVIRNIVVYNKKPNGSNNNSCGTVKEPLSDSNKLQFFRNQFGADRFTPATQIVIMPNKNIQAATGQHFLIQADGTLDIS